MPTLIGIGSIGIAASAIMGLVRFLFFYLDTLVYSWCGGIFGAAMQMYDINLFMETSNILSNFADLIYSFLAIFMFFKVAFSLLTMIIDPAQIEDKQKGASKLIQNIFVCLALIVAVPAIFNGAREIQTTIIDDKIIENAIYGKGYKDDSTVGDKLAVATWSLFIQPTSKANASTRKLWDDAFNIETASNSWEVKGELINDLNKKSSGKYEIAYIWGISTILGVYLLWTFVKLAIDVAYRSLKFFILQLVSPIAIVSYIDPKSGKDGIFAKWTKECIKTYASLFVRIFIYSLASTIMVEFSKTTFNGNAFNKIIYLLAIVALIKSGPKMFDNIFGTEISKDSETKFASDMLRSVVGAGAGMIAGGISGAAVAKGMKLSNEGVGRMAWEGIKKGATGGFSSGKKGDAGAFVKAMWDNRRGNAGRSYYGLPSVADSKKASERMRLAKDKALNVAATKEKYTSLKKEPKSERQFRKNVLEDYLNGTVEQQKLAEETIMQMGYAERDSDGNYIRLANGKLKTAVPITNASGEIDDEATMEADTKRAIITIAAKRQKYRKIRGDAMSADDLYEDEFAKMIKEKAKHDTIAYVQSDLAETYSGTKSNLNGAFSTAVNLKNVSGLRAMLAAQKGQAYMSEMKTENRTALNLELDKAISVCDSTAMSADDKLIALQTIMTGISAQYDSATGEARGNEAYSSGKAKDAAERIKGLAKDIKHQKDATTYDLASEGDPYLDSKDIIAEAGKLRNPSNPNNP